MPCACHFCANSLAHPPRHTSFQAISHRLLHAESLDPRDSIAQRACNTCGHTEDDPMRRGPP